MKKNLLLITIIFNCLFTFSQSIHNEIFSSTTPSQNCLEGKLYYLNTTDSVLPESFDENSYFGKEYLTKLYFKKINNTKIYGKINNVGIQYRGFFYINSDGYYELELSSKGSARVYLNNQLILRHNLRYACKNIGTIICTGSKQYLPKGLHTIELQYFDYNNKEKYCRVRIGKYNLKLKVLDLEEYSHRVSQGSILDSLINAGEYTLQFNQIINFDSGESELDDISYNIINKIFNDFPVLSDTIITVVEGHTDDVGSEENNRILSNARAKNIGTYLQNISPLKGPHYIIGHGEENPIIFGNNQKDRRFNRRISVTFFSPHRFDKIKTNQYKLLK